MFTWHFNGLDKRTNKANLKGNGCGPVKTVTLASHICPVTHFLMSLLKKDHPSVNFHTIVREENVCQGLLVDTLLTQSHSGLEGIP